MTNRLTVAALALLSIGLLSCSDSSPVGDGGVGQDKSSAPMGTLNGPCYPNKTCNTGLICVNGKCVPRNDAGRPDGFKPVLDLPRWPDLVQRPDRRIRPDAPLRPDMPVRPDMAPPPPDSGPLCTPPGFKAVTYKSDLTGDWTVALEPKTSYKTIKISGAGSKDAAGTADYNISWQQVAGFIMSKSTSATSVSVAAAAAVAAIKSQIYGTVTTRDAGLSTRTHEGYFMTKDIILDVTLKSTSDVSILRGNVLAAVLGTTTSSLGGLPGVFGAPSTTFVVRMSVVLRVGGRLIITGALTDLASDNDRSKNTSLVATDLAGASGVAAHGKTPTNACDNLTVTKPVSPVDIIWVMDESGSMNTKRNDLAKNAGLFFSEALKAGLNFRMGVTNVVHPPNASCIGKFCSNITTNSSDTGGTDRFLLPSEQTIFAACIRNPPCYEGGSEYGLLNAKEAVNRHLPRAVSANNKIRTGAIVVIIVVTDEYDNGISSLVSGHTRTCVLPATNQTALDARLKTDYYDYFDGTTTKEAKLDYFHTIGGVCGNSCNAQIAHGYKELAKRYNGSVYDVCAKDLSASVKKIIDGIVATGSPLKLTGTPITASLAVALNGKTQNRSLLKGFDYLPRSNAIMFFGATPAKGDKVAVAYKKW